MTASLHPSRLVEVSLDAVRFNPDQPRKSFGEDGLRELAESIRQHGLIQPIVVTADGEGYTIVAGERRFRAARSLGMETVSVLVLDGEQSDELFEVLREAEGILAGLRGSGE